MVSAVRQEVPVILQRIMPGIKDILHIIPHDLLRISGERQQKSMKEQQEKGQAL